MYSVKVETTKISANIGPNGDSWPQDQIEQKSYHQK